MLCWFSEKKAPIISGPSPFLISVVDDGLGTGPVIVVFLDDGSTVGRLTLLDNSGAISVAVVVPMALANAYASPNRTNADANFVGQCRCSKCRNGGNDKQALHLNLLFLQKESNKETWQKFPTDGDRDMRLAALASQLNHIGT
jgi:hypothetical protein